jgi:hypothetical protein
MDAPESRTPAPPSHPATGRITFEIELITLN